MLVNNYRRIPITMAKRPKRASFARLAVGLASLAFPLFVTGVAQAGIAGSLPATMTLHPVLRAAAITGTSTVEACFDKTLSTTAGGTVADFTLGGYRAANTSVIATSVPVDPTNTNCVIVNFPATVDTSQYTVLKVSAGAVTGNTSGLTNVADSVGLTGSPSHSGTIGITTAPNLVGIVPPNGSNLTSDSLTFVFDKNVGATTLPTTPDPTKFFFVTGAGTICNGAVAGILGGTGTSAITVTFLGGCGASTVASAVRGGVTTGAVVSASDPASINVNQSAVLPNAPNNGQTLLPDLVGTSLGSDNDSVVYTFDKNVVLATGGATRFVAELADGSQVNSTSAVATGGTTVTARFSGSLAVNAEFGVIGWVGGGGAGTAAVVAADNPLGFNVPGSGGIGDNAGAFARAFTTAPDVFAINIAKAAGTVSVNLDDRAKLVDTTKVVLFDVAGDPIVATPIGTSFNSTAGPGPETVTVAYPPSALTNVASVQFLAGAFTTNGLAATTTPAAPTGDELSINQLVGPLTNASILKEYKAFKAHHAKSHKKHSSKKHHRSHKR